MALLVLLARAAPAGIVAADLLPIGLDHRGRVLGWGLVASAAVALAVAGAGAGGPGSPAGDGSRRGHSPRGLADRGRLFGPSARVLKLLWPGGLRLEVRGLDVDL